jgi:hypothetical protein
MQKVMLPTCLVNVSNALALDAQAVNEIVFCPVLQCEFMDGDVMHLASRRC